MILGFTGARRGLTPAQFHALAGRLGRTRTATELVHGDALGADEQAHYIALGSGLAVRILPCDREGQRAFCRGAVHVADPKPPLARNEDIVAACDCLLACPSGPEHARSGTWATVRAARRLRRPVVILWPDGTFATDRPPAAPDPGATP